MVLPHARNFARKQLISHQAIWASAISICSTLVAIYTWILIAHSLGPRIFGIYMLARWLTILAVPFIGVGTSTLTSMHVTSIQSRETPRMMAGIFFFLWHRQSRSVLYYFLSYLLLAYPLHWLFAIESPLSLLLASIAMMPQLLSVVVGTTLRGLQRSDLLLILHLLNALLNLLLALIATQFDGYLTDIFLITGALASTLTLIMAIICVTRLLPLHTALQPGIFLREKLLHGLHRSFRAFFLDTVVWQHSEIFLLALRHRSAEVGLYALCALCCNTILKIAPVFFSTWIAPLLYHYFPHHRYLNRYDAFVKTSCYITFVAAPICIFIMVLSPIFITFCFGPDYLPLIPPLRILLVSAAFGSIAAVSFFHLAHEQKQQFCLRLGIGAALVNIGLAVPFIALWGMSGAALASCSAQLVSAGGAILFCRQMLENKVVTSRSLQKEFV